MAKLYIKYSPSRIGLTGSEYLPGFLDAEFPAVKCTDVASDGFNRFSILEGSGDDLFKMLLAVTDRFSIKQLSEIELIGYARINYRPVAEDVPDFETYISNFGFMNIDELAAIKAAKKDMFKELVRKRLAPNNEVIADVMKAVVLFHFYYDDLDMDEKNIVDGKTADLKNVYTKARCINAYSSLVDSIKEVVEGYYNAAADLDSQTDPDLALAVDYL